MEILFLFIVVNTPMVEHPGNTYRTYTLEYNLPVPEHAVWHVTNRHTYWYMYAVHRGATISLVGRHNIAIVQTKRPLPARYNTPLPPFVVLSSCAAISGAQIPHRLPKNVAKPVAVPRTATGNASGVHPKSYDGIFQ